MYQHLSEMSEKGARDGSRQNVVVVAHNGKLLVFAKLLQGSSNLAFRKTPPNIHRLRCHKGQTGHTKSVEKSSWQADIPVRELKIVLPK